jgi:hypothetical protein
VTEERAKVSPGVSLIFYTAIHNPQGGSREVHFERTGRGAKLGKVKLSEMDCEVRKGLRKTNNS